MELSTVTQFYLPMGTKQYTTALFCIDLISYTAYFLWTYWLFVFPPMWINIYSANGN